MLITQKLKIFKVSLAINDFEWNFALFTMDSAMAFYVKLLHPLMHMSKKHHAQVTLCVMDFKKELVMGHVTLVAIV